MPQETDLIGVGSPVVDLLAHVSDDFVKNVGGDKGGMELVDSEALTHIVGSLPEPPTQVPGGSAGNTTYAAARIGSKIAFLGKLGDDHSADFYRERFSIIGADTSRFKVGDVPNAMCISLVTPDSQRTMRTDLGAAMTLTPDEVTETDFADSRHVHLEGYLLFNRDLMLKTMQSAKAAGCTISLDMASFEVVNASEDILGEWLEEYIDIVFANEDEAAAFFPDLGEDFEAMARGFAELCDIGVVKLGADGSLIAHEDEIEFVEPVAIETLEDTTGAGDYFAGGFLHAWLRDKPLSECGRYGSILGAEVVQVLGPALPEARWEALREELG